MWLRDARAASLATASSRSLIGALVVRLYGIYFALLTLAFAQMVFFIVFQWRDLTNGDDGLQGISTPPLDSASRDSILSSAAVALASARSAISRDVKLLVRRSPRSSLSRRAALHARRWSRSQFGEVLAAIRENEERSTFVGFNPAATSSRRS